MIKELKCELKRKDTGRHCEWKARSDDDEEILRQAAQHGQQEHGTKDFNEDIREGLRAKIRDVKSPQIRSSSSLEAD